MDVTINYGNGRIRLALPDNVIIDEYKHKTMNVATDFDQFKKLLSGQEECFFNLSTADLFIVNDAYRPTPTSAILEWLDSLGRLNDHASFLIATGCHQAPNDEQMRKIFGSLYGKLKNRIIIHDARDQESMSPIGTDRFGEQVCLNKIFLRAERIVIIGSVEPHYFAGFTGGRKSLFPGVCDYPTTVRNHRLAADFAAQPMKLAGNPVDEHLHELMELVDDRKLIMSIQTIPGTDSDHRLIVIGGLHDSFEQAVALAREVYGCRVDDRYDLLLAEVLPPLDSNLYQLQKSLENCQSAVNDGGTVILFSACREGIGSGSFYALADKWTPGRTDNLTPSESFGIHKLVRVHAIGERVDVFLHSELEDGTSDKVFFKTLKEPEEYVNRIIKERKISRVALVHDAGHTILAN